MVLQGDCPWKHAALSASGPDVVSRVQSYVRFQSPANCNSYGPVLQGLTESNSSEFTLKYFEAEVRDPSSLCSCEHTTSSSVVFLDILEV